MGKEPGQRAVLVMWRSLHGYAGFEGPEQVPARQLPPDTSLPERRVLKSEGHRSPLVRGRVAGLHRRLPAEPAEL